MHNTAAWEDTEEPVSEWKTPGKWNDQNKKHVKTWAEW